MDGWVDGKLEGVVCVGMDGTIGQGAGKKYIKGSEVFVFCRFFFRVFCVLLCLLSLLPDQWVVT